MARLSNYELIRVISMIFIVYHHLSVHSAWGFDKEDRGFRRKSVEFLGTGGKVGVDLFIMLTGYFHAGKPAKVVSVIRTWIQVAEYSWGFYFIFYFYRDMKKDDFLTSIFPVICFNYWFVSAYMVVILLSPAIGKMAKYMSHNEYFSALMIMFLTMSILRYFYNFVYSDTFWFIFLYLLGGYFKIFESYYERCKTRTYLIGMVFFFLVDAGAIVLFTSHNFDWVSHHGGVQMLTIHTYAPLPILLSIFIFLFVGRLKFSSPIVNTLAYSSFGVYLIHDNRYIRFRIWRDWVNGNSHREKPEFYPFIILAPLAVYFISSAIDWLKQLLLSRAEQWLADFLANKVIAIGRLISHYCLHTDDNTAHYELQDLDLDIESQDFDIESEPLNSESPYSEPQSLISSPINDPDASEIGSIETLPLLDDVPIVGKVARV